MTSLVTTLHDILSILPDGQQALLRPRVTALVQSILYTAPELLDERWRQAAQVLAEVVPESDPLFQRVSQLFSAGTIARAATT